MKRFIAIAALSLMSLCFGSRLSAGNVGLIGGANFYTPEITRINAYSMTLWHAGLTYKFDLPAGFQIQPAILYNVKGTRVVSEYGKNLSMGFLEFMVPVQWGVDLILFRPFLEAAPFIGYGVNNWATERMEYGVGLGGGLQIWRFQATARYNWNFGKMMNLGNVTLSLAFFF